jgi:signal transduction histidine kinase
MLAHLALQQHVELQLAPTGGTGRVRMDEAQMQQVIANLLLNAIQAMPEGGRVEIAIDQVRISQSGRASSVRDYVRLVIADEGTGIPPQNLPRIFEPFFTTKDVGDGTGLGLSVCYGIVQEHGGWIQADSEVGKGSRFSVYLPALGAQMPELAAGETPS